MHAGAGATADVVAEFSFCVPAVELGLTFAFEREAEFVVGVGTLRLSRE